MNNLPASEYHTNLQFKHSFKNSALKKKKSIWKQKVNRCECIKLGTVPVCPPVLGWPKLCGHYTQ